MLGLSLGMGHLRKAGATASTSFVFIAAQSAGNTGQFTGCTTAAINTTGATLLVMAVASLDAATPAISDSAGNSWTKLTVTSNGSDVINLAYVLNPTTSATHTFSFPAAGNYGAIAVAAFSGGQEIFDAQSAGSHGTSASPSGGSLTPAQSSEIIIAAVETHNLTTVNSIDSSFVIPTNGTFAGRSNENVGVGLAYLIRGSAAPANPTWTLSGSDTWVSANYAFK